MTVNQKIEKAMKSVVGKNIWPLNKPTEENPAKWIVYNPANEVPADYGDNEDLEWKHEMQVHYFEPGHVNYLNIRKRMRKYLKEAGFWIESTYEVYDPDLNLTHVVVTCEIIEDDPYEMR